MSKKKKIYIYGTGRTAEYIVDNAIDDDIEVLGMIESEKSASQWRTYPVYELSEIYDAVYDEIWIANAAIETLYACINAGVDKRKIVICNEHLFREYIAKTKICDVGYMCDLAEEFEIRERNINRREIKVLTNALYLHESVAYESLTYDHNYMIHEDYFRFALLKILSEEVRRRNVKGALAELGVYQGRTARVLNHENPDRELYLFDTFSGLPEKDVEIETENNYTEWVTENSYSDTSISMVLENMDYPETCIICDGYFPDTIPDKEVEYALVSIGVTLYKPTLDGLKYFYPRLAKGGYLIVNCYNSPACWRGVKIAVDKLVEENKDMIMIPIPDRFGSVIIAK